MGAQDDIAPVSREECDLGQGFYMGTTTLQPLTFVCAEAKPKFYTVELDLTGLKVLRVGIDMDWAMLIDLSVARRKEGIALAEDIGVKYRREGKFFDEILRGGLDE